MNLHPDLSLIELETTGSTNEYAKDLARNGGAHGTLVWAHEQTAGKGRLGNQWQSFGGNLYMSMILRPQVTAALTGQLSFLISVALAQVLEEKLPPQHQARLKWPNDVLLDRRKVAGILLETELNGIHPVSWVVAGVGVNIASAPEGAIALQECGISMNARGMMEILSGKIISLYNDWRQNGFAQVREFWLSRAYNIGGEINVRLPSETLQGIFMGIDRAGALELKMHDGGVRIISSGEVYL